VKTLLKAENLTLKFGGLVAVNNVSFEVQKGEILSIIGPNGAGKTSLFNLISGLYHPTSGRIFFEDKELVQVCPLIKKFQWFILSLVLAFIFTVLVNAQELWKAVISDLYIFRADFSYLQSLEATVNYFLELHYSWTLMPFTASLIVSLAAAYQFERSARIGPVVAARAGIARTFQNLRLMPSTSVLENVKVACRSSRPPGVVSAMLSLAIANKYEQLIEDQALESLRVLELAEFSSNQAGDLPYGLQRRVEIARAIAAHPKLIILDEPAAGLNPSESRELLVVIKKIAQTGMTVLLIEHDMSVVMEVSDRIVVLHYGSKIAEGTPQEIRNNPEVTKAYLGTDHE
jgi:branched-chain amino acid transport system ATP-binding protein